MTPDEKEGFVILLIGMMIGVFLGSITSSYLPVLLLPLILTLFGLSVVLWASAKAKVKK